MSVEQNDIEGSENDSSGSESFLNLRNDIIRFEMTCAEVTTGPVCSGQT